MSKKSSGKKWTVRTVMPEPKQLDLFPSAKSGWTIRYDKIPMKETVTTTKKKKGGKVGNRLY